jgi:hypothetical protein
MSRSPPTSHPTTAPNGGNQWTILREGGGGHTPWPLCADGPQDPYNFNESDEEEGPQNPALQGPRDMTRCNDNGYVPKFWGLREVEGFPRYERDNCLRQMLSRSVYFSPRTNTVFTGQMATDAS